MTKKILLLIFFLLIGVFLDTAGIPFLVGNRVGLHFTAAVVSVAGLQLGWFAGLASGWVGGLLLASLSASPVGLFILSLGVAGYAGGMLRRFIPRHIRGLGAIAMVCLVFLEDVIAGLAASLYLGTGWRVSAAGVLVSSAVVFLIFWKPLQTTLGEER